MGAKKNDKPAGGKAKPAKAKDDSKQRPWWFNLPEPIDRFTGWLSICTAMLCVATIGLGVVAYKTDETLKKTLSVSQRAWVAPMRVSMTGDFAFDAKGRFSVYYKNTGNAPAIKVRHLAVFGFIPIANKMDWSDFCKDDLKEAEPSWTVYPSDSFEYQLVVDGPTEGPIHEVLEGTHKLNLKGCFVYETFTEIHRSQFCFTWDYVKDKPLNNWPWSFCQTGNEAD